MAESQVTVAARIRARPDTQQQTRQGLLDLVLKTQAEDGCIGFDLHQSLDDPCRFRIAECWRNQAALSRHMEQPHLKAWLEVSKTLVAEPIEITLWKMISGPT